MYSVRLTVLKRVPAARARLRGVAASVIFVTAVASPASAQQELATREGGKNDTREFQWFIRWSPANGAVIAPGNSDAVTMPSFVGTLPGWSGTVERGAFGGSAAFDDFRFRARHVLGPHTRGDAADVNPNPGDGTFFDLFELIDALGLPATANPNDFVDVPSRVGAGSGLVGAATVTKDHPIVRGTPHLDEFTLRYRTVVARAGGTVDFEFTGVHLCEPRPRVRGPGGPVSAADVDECDCECTVTPEPASLTLLAAGLAAAGAGAAIRRTRRRPNA